jgi:RimJ/RimL family protein N-acetyltransferase
LERARFDVFIEGEVVDLCAPSDEPWVLDQWYRWFNKKSVTTYLAQGMFPNTRQAQKAFFDSVTAAKDRLVLMIKPKHEERFIGVASLSSIDRIQRQCDFAMVIGEQLDSADSLFFALETKCRMTEHAFEVVGVERINSTQVVDLIKWQRWQILFGYQVEGVLRKKFRKGRHVYDVFVSSCLLEDYLALRKLRHDAFWPGKTQMFELLKLLPPRTLLDESLEWLKEKQDQYWKTLTFGV